MKTSPRVNNPLFSNSFLIFATRFFPSLATLVVMILYSKNLPPAQYGLYQRFWIQLFLFAPIACFGVHVLFITYSRNIILGLLSNLRRKYYVWYALWLLFIAIVFTLFQSLSAGYSFFIPFLFLICYAVSTILESVLIVCRNFALLIVTSVLYSAAFCAIHWFSLAQGLSLPTLFLYLLGLTLARTIVYGAPAFASIKYYKEQVALKTHVGNIRSLWLHLGLYDILQILFSYVDKFIISLVLTAELSAIYFNGSQNIPFIPLLLGAAGNAVLLQLAAGVGKAEPTTAVRLMRQSGKLLSCIVFPVFFYLLLFRSELIVTIFSIKYRAAIPVFAVSLLSLPLRAYSFTTVLQKLHKGAIINAGAIGDLVIACAFMYPLYKLMGLPGVALSFVASTYLQAIYYLFQTSRFLKVSVIQLLPVIDWISKLALFGALFVAIHYTGRRFFSVHNSLILGGTIMCLLILLSLWLELRKQKRYGSIQ